MKLKFAGTPKYIDGKEVFIYQDVNMMKYQRNSVTVIRTGQIKATDNVLCWHTGGAPALFAYADDLDIR